MRPSNLTVLALLVLSIVGPVQAAAQESAALGHDGRLQRVVATTYAELFGDDVDATQSVLAFETLRPGEAASRILVPTTDDYRVEVEPRLFQDPKYQTSVLVWRSLAAEGQTEEIDSLLHFASFDGAEWSDVHVIETDGAPLAVATTPQIAETRDTFELELEDDVTLYADRRILHLVWQNADEIPTTFYVPLTFVEGRYLGWHGVVALNEAFFLEPESGADGDDTSEGEDPGSDDPGEGEDPDAETPEPVHLTPALGQTLNLRVASDPRSVLVTFANLASQRLGTVEVSPLPLELGLLGEQIRDQLFALADLYNPDDPTALSDEMRAGIIIIGLQFNLHEAYGEYVANRVADWILEAGGAYGWGGFESLGNDARNLAIDVSNEVFTSTKVDPADPNSEIVEINIAGLLGELDEADPAQTIDILVRSDMPAPAIGQGLTTLYTSRSGDRQLVTWEDEEGGAIHWVESQRQGTWSEPFSLPIDESLTFDEAHRLLAAKVR